MQATELRIGNLVHDQNHYGGGMDIVIDSIDVTSETKWWWDDLQPILITEEKLLEFGFDNEEGWCLPHGKFGYFELYNHGNGLWYQSVNGGEYTIGKAMKFIHELQNRFYSFSGEELTIKQ